MVDGIHPNLPTTRFTQVRPYKVPIIVAVALGALLFFVGFIVVRRLLGYAERIKPEDFYDQSLTALKEDRCPEAVRLLSSALQSSSDTELNAQILQKRGECYLEMAKKPQPKTQAEYLDKAESDFNAALLCHPTNPMLLAKIHDGLATVVAQKNFHALAVQEYNLALACKPLEEEFASLLHYKRGLSWVDLGDNEEAIKDFTAALKPDLLGPTLRARILLNRSLAYVKLKRPNYSLALKDLDSAVGCNLSNGDFRRTLYRARASIHIRLDNTLQAITDLNEALEHGLVSDEERLEILMTRAPLYTDPSMKDQAREDLKAAERLNPKNPNSKADILRQLATLDAEEGKLGSALEQLNIAIGLKPTEGLDLCLLIRAHVFVGLQRLEDAFKDFTQGISVASKAQTRAQFFLGRGDIHFRKHNPADAKKDWEAAAELQFDDQELRTQIAARFIQGAF